MYTDTFLISYGSVLGATFAALFPVGLEIDQH